MKVVATLATGDVQPGMCLAEPVVDDMGRVLVPAGCELTESILQSLLRREIAEVTVERELAEDPADREARRLLCIKQLDALFRMAGDGSETRQLYQSILAFRLEQGQ